MLYYGLAYVIAQQIETGFCEGRSCPEGEERAEQQDPELTQEPVHASGMEWRSHGNDNDDLVSKLKRNKIIKSRRVEDAMRKVDRGNYCSISPYMDSPQAIGYGVTISAPHMHAHALEMLKDHLYEGAKALDVGSGMIQKFYLMQSESSNKGVILSVFLELKSHSDCFVREIFFFFFSYLGVGWGFILHPLLLATPLYPIPHIIMLTQLLLYMLLPMKMK